MTERHLLLLRHAKSAWDDAGLDDHARPLAERGQRAGGLLRRWLAEASLPRPDLILCSDAVRAVQTLALVRPAWGAEAPPVDFRRELYAFTAGPLRGVLAGVAETVGCLMVVGHNPALEELALDLVGEGAPVALEPRAKDRNHLVVSDLSPKSALHFESRADSRGQSESLGDRDWPRSALERLRAKYPTAALAHVVLPEGSAWADLAPQSCRLAGFVRPADLA